MSTSLTQQRGELVTEEVRQPSNSVRVDSARGVIKNVFILGEVSKNNRVYPPAVMKKAVRLYEGVKVNTDHPEANQLNRPRRISERFGVLRNVHFQEGKGLVGDLHYNPKHALAEQIAWDAEHNPSAFGLSHAARIVTASRRTNGKATVSSIEAVRSVDVVADPATTNSIYESEEFEESAEELTAEQWHNRITGRPDATEAQETLKRIYPGRPARQVTEQAKPAPTSSQEWLERITSN